MKPAHVAAYCIALFLSTGYVGICVGWYAAKDAQRQEMMAAALEAARDCTKEWP